MSAQHTPGPWVLDACCEGGWMLLAKGHDITAEPFDCSDADAALIAAAPDLLAALARIANSEEMDGDSFVCDFDTLQGVARAAIRKATGAA